MSPRTKDLTGQTFGRLTVLSFAGTNRKRNSLWLAECNCPSHARRTVLGYSLTKGHTMSCGCLQAERSAESQTVHGLRGEPWYISWHGAKTRCHDKRHKAYSYYGGRGLTMCSHYKTDDSAGVVNFGHDMGPTFRPGLTIDRPDNGDGYHCGSCDECRKCPRCKARGFTSNLRWSTRRQQMCNTRYSRLLTFNGKTMSMSHWADALGLPRRTLGGRLDRGWPLERALQGRSPIAGAP
jgi:hypothetical protein